MEQAHHLSRTIACTNCCLPGLHVCINLRLIARRTINGYESILDLLIEDVRCTSKPSPGHSKPLLSPRRMPYFWRCHVGSQC
jgi:hypothetical protein